MNITKAIFLIIGLECFLTAGKGLCGEMPSHINFPLQRNGGSVLTQSIDYELSRGHFVKLGEIDFDLDHCVPNFGPQIEAEGALYALHFAWPTKLISTGQLSIRDFKTEEILFKTSQSTIDAPPSKVAAKNPGNPLVHINASEEKIPLESLLDRKKQRELRFCIQSLSSMNTTICSRPYSLKNTARGYIFYEVQTESRPAVKFNQKMMPLSGSAELTPGVTSTMEITSQSGSVIRVELTSITSQYDAVFKTSQGRLVLDGHDAEPAKSVVSTDGKEWHADLSVREPYIFYSEGNGFQIKQNFKFSPYLLPEEARTFLDPKSRRATYRSHVLLHGKTNEDFSVSSTQNKAELTTPPEFVWDFNSEKKRELNRSEINFYTKSGESFVGVFDIYRGLPYEASVNFSSGTTDAGTIPIFGDLKLTAWLEQIPGTENTTWSLHRWGAHLNALATVINANNQFGHTVGYTSLEGDIRYTLKPGLWNHDEAFGPVLNYQYIQFNAASANMAGVGAFWSRQIPKTWDEYISRFNWLKHPKWFELQGNYFILPANGSTVLGRNFDILTNLKMFMWPTVFAQFGIDYRQYDFINQNNFILIQTNTTTFSLGGGIQF
jgi:hypothetical protein